MGILDWKRSNCICICICVHVNNKSLDLLTDNSVIDDIFGTDSLMADFNNINNVVMNDPENVGNRENEIVTCPICEDKMPRYVI